MTGIPASAGGGSPARNVAPRAATSAEAAARRAGGGPASPASPETGTPGESRARRGAETGRNDDRTGGRRRWSARDPAAEAGGDTGGPSDGSRPPRSAKITAAAVNQTSVWNIANLLTMLRLMLVPAFVALMLAEGGYDPAWRAFAWAAFAVAMITDLFDGHLARAYDLVTDFGKIADPIADKAIMGAALVCLSFLDELPWWVTGVILGRELGVTLLRFVVIRYGVIPASRGGKLKTLTQGVAVGMYVLALTGPLATLRFWVMAVAVVLTVATGLDYVKQAIVLRGRGIAESRAVEGRAET
ncbi:MULTISPECIES: CDP-diacylglycerol--glycerol-3-phosphate 3-phosphatidyltransferase [unclassified Streptomyces]|uniref:CDP-diacylglycerol--glycerol-3-phosphate 3-phosphatidyltransferase n=1 Tax=unclassified Streptomyces TaxID=2593676 RepID=UPI001906BC73|nr:CDP-diacylglycerol--glycerol-3-phosphate 3-phosphatidyltransferase [Streptomyces sp. HSG2]